MKTTNTIYNYYSKDVNQAWEYIGLDKAANEAFQYMVEAYAQQLPFSEIIKNMPKDIGYTLHIESFELAFQLILDNLSDLSQKKDLILRITKMDDLDLYEKIHDDVKLQLKIDAFTKYAKFEFKYNMDYIGNVPAFDKVPISVIPEDNYITLPANEPQSSTPSEYATEFSFDNNNKQILLYTILAFVAIRAIAYYYKDDSQKLAENSCYEQHIENESLNSAYESLFLSSTSLYKLFLYFVPISFLIIYKLRYYYFYRLSKIYF